MLTDRYNIDPWNIKEITCARFIKKNGETVVDKLILRDLANIGSLPDILEIIIKDDYYPMINITLNNGDIIAHHQ